MFPSLGEDDVDVLFRAEKSTATDFHHFDQLSLWSYPTEKETSD